MTDDLLLPRHPAAPAPEPLRFTGTGAEYFRIWIVNLLLTIVTLGIYSAWAKVRRLQYFHRHTQLAGSGFDYHGRPAAILKGRAVAFGALVLYKIADEMHPDAGKLVALAIALALPWVLTRSAAFRLANTSWRGLRFRFDGSTADGYRTFLLWPLAALATLGALAPVAHREITAFHRGNAAFGRAPFAFSATNREFYRVWLRTVGLFLGLPALLFLTGLVLGVQATSLGGGLHGFGVTGAATLMLLGGIAAYSGFIAAKPYFTAHIQNLVWGRTTLATHRFECDLRFGMLLWIGVSNLVLTILTLGLYRPFGMVRMARYRVAAITLIPGESLDDFIGERVRDVEAFGDELADFLDIDIAL